VGSGELVSIIVPTYNRSSKLVDCLKALCAQSYQNIEIIVADDCSTDNTVAAVREIMAGDPRVLVVQNPVNKGAAAARNRAIAVTRGSIVFFTDDDVLVPVDWVSSGLRIFEGSSCLGVEGRLVYVSETYRPRYRDRLVSNLAGGNYMTANMAYRKDALLRAGLFSEAFRGMEDRELAVRVLRCGSIDFSAEVTVTHMLDVRTVRSYLREAVQSARWIQVNQETGEKIGMLGFVYRPDKLLTLLCPPLVLASLSSARFTGPYDYFLLLFLYPRLWYERFQVWRWAARYKKFII
jgi:glycosyltransferase involved in cell wall biosynthesis